MLRYRNVKINQSSDSIQEPDRHRWTRPCESACLRYVLFRADLVDCCSRSLMVLKSWLWSSFSHWIIFAFLSDNCPLVLRLARGSFSGVTIPFLVVYLARVKWRRRYSFIVRLVSSPLLFVSLWRSFNAEAPVYVHKVILWVCGVISSESCASTLNCFAWHWVGALPSGMRDCWSSLSYCSPWGISRGQRSSSFGLKFAYQKCIHCLCFQWCSVNWCRSIRSWL